MNQQYAQPQNFNQAPVNQQSSQRFNPASAQNEDPVNTILNEVWLMVAKLRFRLNNQ